MTGCTPARVRGQRQRILRASARHVGVSPSGKDRLQSAWHADGHCHIETFNGSFRDECLNLHWFETLGEAKAIIEAWRRDYNESRPHSALKELAPAEFVRQLVLLPESTGPETPENSLQVWSGKPRRINRYAIFVKTEYRAPVRAAIADGGLDGRVRRGR